MSKWESICRAAFHHSESVRANAVFGIALVREVSRLEDVLFGYGRALAILSEDVSPAVRKGLTEVEARVLELMLRRERRTAIYADACGIADRLPEEQRRLVKQIKDRLQKRIERQRGP